MLTACLCPQGMFVRSCTRADDISTAAVMALQRRCQCQPASPLAVHCRQASWHHHHASRSCTRRLVLTHLQGRACQGAGECLEHCLVVSATQCHGAISELQCNSSALGSAGARWIRQAACVQPARLGAIRLLLQLMQGSSMECTMQCHIMCWGIIWQLWSGRQVLSNWLLPCTRRCTAMTYCNGTDGVLQLHSHVEHDVRPIPTSKEHPEQKYVPCAFVFRGRACRYELMHVMCTTLCWGMPIRHITSL